MFFLFVWTSASSPWWNIEAHWDDSAWSLIVLCDYCATVLLIKMLKKETLLNYDWIYKIKM